MIPRHSYDITGLNPVKTHFKGIIGTAWYSYCPVKNYDIVQ